MDEFPNPVYRVDVVRLIQTAPSKTLKLFENVAHSRDLCFGFEEVCDFLLVEYSAENPFHPVVVLVLSRFYNTQLELFRIRDRILKNNLRGQFFIREEIHEQERVLA